MATRFVSFLAIALLVLSAAAGCGTSPGLVRTPAGQAIAGAVARGKVSDKATGRPVAGAAVRLAGGTARTVTAQDGTFALGPIPARGGQITVSAEGYAERTLAVPPGAREILVVHLARETGGPAYKLSLTMQAGRLDGSGRVALQGDRLLATGREGKLGSLFNLDRVTGEEHDRFSWASMFTPLPLELADLAAHPRAGTFLLTNAGRVFVFDGSGRLTTSADVADGPGAIASDGRHVYVAAGREIRVLDPALGGEGAWPFPYGDPSGLALDGLGNLYVSTWDGRVLEFDADRRLIADWRAPGARRLAGLALDAAGLVHATDPDGKRVIVLGAGGQPRGAFGAGDLQNPRGVAVDEDGAAYVGDVGLRAVLRFDRIPGTSAFKAHALP